MIESLNENGAWLPRTVKLTIESSASNAEAALSMKRHTRSCSDVAREVSWTSRPNAVRILAQF